MHTGFGRWEERFARVDHLARAIMCSVVWTRDREARHHSITYVAEVSVGGWSPGCSIIKLIFLRDRVRAFMLGLVLLGRTDAYIVCTYMYDGYM